MVYSINLITDKKEYQVEIFIILSENPNNSGLFIALYKYGLLKRSRKIRDWNIV